jgi:hypothetical protein
VNPQAIQPDQAAQLDMEHCIASNNTQVGVEGLAIGAVAATVHIESCVMSNNAVGVRAESDEGGTTTVRVSNSTITDNGTGLFVTVQGPTVMGTMASILSRGNNTIEDNTTEISVLGPGASINGYTAD